MRMTLTTKSVRSVVTPLLTDGSYRLYLGTGAGEVIALDPATLVPEDLQGTPGQCDAWCRRPRRCSGLTRQAAPLPASTPASVQVEPSTGQPPAGFYRPEGDFAISWENDARGQYVGWATTAEPTTSTAALPALRPWRHALGARDRAHLCVPQRWPLAQLRGHFPRGEAEFDPAFSPPDGRQQPMRGFGKVWREHTDLRDAIGWGAGQRRAGRG